MVSVNSHLRPSRFSQAHYNQWAVENTRADAVVVLIESTGRRTGYTDRIMGEVAYCWAQVKDPGVKLVDKFRRNQ